jgi:tetratricopeptide (TPR) repeat protein
VLLLKDKNNRLVNYDFRNNLILSHRQLDGEVVSLGPLPAENRLVVVYDNKTQILKMDWLTKEWENDTIKPSTNTSVSATQYPHILMIKSGNKVSLFNAIYGKYTSEFNITSNITCAATGGSYYAVLMEEGDIFISRISYGGKKTTRKEEPNAYPYFQKLMASYHLKHLHDRLKNYYIARLINYSNNVIEPLIAGEISNETNTDLVYAEQCLNLAESLNVESVLINRKIEISRQLISVFSELITYNYDNYQKAITNLKELIQLYPDASYSLNTMSRIYLRLNEILNAQKTSIHAINNNPFWSEPRISYARSLIKNNEYYKALETLDSVCHQFPESRNACLLSGDVYLFLGNFDRANLFYGKADSIDSDAYSMSKLAQVLILQRKYRDAIVMLENTIVQNGGSPYASLMLGKLYLHIYFEALNDLNINSEYFHVAITNLEDANRLGPESPHIKLEYLKLALTEFNGMLVLAQKKQNSSSQPTSPFTAQDYKSRMTNDAHRVYENKEEIQNDLLYNARKLLKSDPYYYPTYKLIADILASMGRTKEALEMFDQAISENPEVADLYYFKGMFLADMRKTTEASPYFEKAIQKDIDFLPAYYAYFKAFTTDKKGKAIDINTIKSEEAKRLLNQARERFGNDIFKDSRSINYSKAVPFFFDQIYFY